jgi:hypothetical protein
MSPPRPPPRGDGAEDASSLLHKYQQLLRKHEALVRRLAENNTEHIFTFKLSAWALETSASGLALLRGGRVVLANSRWHALVRLRGPWRWRAGPTDGAPHTAGSLREVAVQESAATLLEAGPRVLRYEQVDGGRVVELSSERVASPEACW